jgi:hypothetical protein
MANSAAKHAMVTCYVIAPQVAWPKLHSRWFSLGKWVNEKTHELAR